MILPKTPVKIFFDFFSADNDEASYSLLILVEHFIGVKKTENFIFTLPEAN